MVSNPEMTMLSALISEELLSGYLNEDQPLHVFYKRLLEQLEDDQPLQDALRELGVRSSVYEYVYVDYLNSFHAVALLIDLWDHPVNLKDVIIQYYEY